MGSTGEKQKMERREATGEFLPCLLEQLAKNKSCVTTHNLVLPSLTVCCCSQALALWTLVWGRAVAEPNLRWALAGHRRAPASSGHLGHLYRGRWRSTARPPRGTVCWCSAESRHTTCRSGLLVHSQLCVLPRVTVLISDCKSRNQRLAKASLLHGFHTDTWENLAVGVCVICIEALGPFVMPSSGVWEACIGSGKETKILLKFSFHLLDWYFVSKS